MVEALEAEVLMQVVAGAKFGDVCDRLVERMGCDRGPQVAGEFLGRWLSDGLVVDISLAR